MYLRRILLACSMAFVSATGCALDGAPDPSDPTAEATSDLAISDLAFYDNGTQCTVGGATMHCCPPGSAMVGAHVSHNIFKCSLMTTPSGAVFLDRGTQRNGMHACPPGTLMVGLHARNNLLACQGISPAPTFEFVDGNPATQDGLPMHICSPGAAMAGIHITNNRFTCEF